MEAKELLKMIEDKKSEVQGKFEEALELFKSGVVDISKYVQLGVIASNYWGSYYGAISKKEVLSDDIECHSIDSLMEHLNEFQEEYKNTNEIGKSDIEFELTADDGFIERQNYKYIYYELDEYKLESFTKEKCREMVTNLLKPDSMERAIAPECKMVELFKNGSIDWKTLQQITYKDCEI